ncbi:MAG TPA: homoserine kinase [Ideonella sp.]|nr:homoserine kinase [Ideonella sp.]
MAVYTEVSLDEARRFVLQLGLGELLALKPVASGIENTNYFVTTADGEWVLTLFERLGFEQLPFYLQLMRHLARHGLPVPEPRADAAGEILHRVAGKPAALVDRLRGEHLDAPDLHHCEQLGATLARLHDAVADFPLAQPNLRGLAWWEDTALLVRPHLGSEQAQLLDGEMAFQRQLAASPLYASLPRGAVHADLFRDNAMFEGLPGRERLSGVFDFYFAGVDTFGFDLAVVLNDWCIDLDSGRVDTARADALVAAYRLAERVASPDHRLHDGAELRLLPALRRSAALRFWLSRLADWHLPRDAALLTPKDPQHFERVLRDCIANPWHPQP